MVEKLLQKVYGPKFAVKFANGLGYTCTVNQWLVQYHSLSELEMRHRLEGRFGRASGTPPTD